MSVHTPPSHLDAECAVLGGVLLQPNLFHDVIEILKPEDFYAPKHRRLFQCMIELESSGEPLDIVTITARLKDQNCLDEAGGPAYVASLLDKVPSTAHITTHAKIIAEAALRRRMIEAGQEVVREGLEGGMTLEQFMDFSESRLYEVAHSRQNKEFADLKTILKENMASIDALYNKKESVTGIPSGYTDFDKLTSGLQRADLIIVAARPSMGKTSLVMNIAVNAAIQTQGIVAVFSLEMNKESLGMRMLASHSKVDSRRLRNGQLYESDWPKLIRAAGILSETSIYIDDRANTSVLEMRSACRRLAAKKPLSLIVVDYLQLMRSHSGRPESREKEISEISRGLKGLAKELQVPVIALSQLNRSLDARPDKRPVMSDLRESGAIEQDADVICFIYRDEVYNKDSDQKGVAEIIIGKQRNGPTGTCYLTWLDKFTRFENFAQGQPQAADVLNAPPPPPPPGSGGGPEF